MVCHRRAGKTVACIADLVLSALVTTKPDARFAYICPQFNQAKDVAWAYIKRLTSDIPSVSYNESELRADLPNGARIRLYGADNPDRLRGIYLDGVILDEFGDMKPRVWGEIIRPLLTDRRGWAVFIGTPKGKNEFWDVWDMAQNDAKWFKMKLKASESGLITSDELEDAKKGMSEDQVEQEFECSFEAAIVGAYYGKELRELTDKGRTKAAETEASWPVHTAWDLGYSDDTAIWFYQVIAGEIRIIDCHSSNGKPIDYYVDLIKSKPYKYGLHWLPHDARAKTLASGGKSIEEMLRFGIGTNIRIVPSLSLQDGIQAARTMLSKAWFGETCEEGVEALRQYQRQWDDDRKCFRDSPLHDWTSHYADAFRMLAIAWKEEYKPVPKPPPRFEQTIREMIEEKTRQRKRDE